MPERSTPDDHLPDLTAAEWRSKFDRAELKRGRPKAATPKISTTIRLDPDVVAAFKANGPGWQSRINQALREAVGLSENEH